MEESIPDASPGLANRTEHKAELAAVMKALLELPVTTVKVKVHRARLKLMHVRATFQEVSS